MKRRAWFGSFIYVIGFNLLVAGVAYFWSVSWAVLILFLRHALMGFPNLYNQWRTLILGKEDRSPLPPVNKGWPGKI